MLKNPLALAQIGIDFLSNILQPSIATCPFSIFELSCLSPRLGNLLLRKLILHQQNDLSKSNDYFLSLFRTENPDESERYEVLIQLTELPFHSCPFINDKSFIDYLLFHELIETIDLRDCNVTYSILSYLTKHFPRLTTLYIGQTEHKVELNKTLIDFFPRNQINGDFYLRKPKLKYLSLENIYSTERSVEQIDTILHTSLSQCSEQIRALDLSRNTAIDNLSYINCFKQIQALILYDIQPHVIEASIDAICQLKTLVQLDISYNRRTQDAPNYTTPTLTLAKIIYSLPKLLSLDISGTNLGGTSSFDRDEELAYFSKILNIDQDEKFTIQSSIPGLLLLKHELEFLGLFDTEDRASARSYLPGKKITGEHTEEMLMTSLVQYAERPGMLTHILAHLFRLYNHSTIQNPLDAGKLVMDNMERHLFDRSLQTSGSACLYYVVDTFQNESAAVLQRYDHYLKRLLITILQAMSTHLHHSPMIRNGLLTISRIQMHLPNHIMSAFKQTVKVLIRFIRLYLNQNVTHEQILLHNALSVLNHIACSVDGDEKLFIGQADAIETAMGIIRSFLRKNLANDIVEIAWTLLWNITDETPENCRRFIEDNEGLASFLDCLEAWPDKRDLIRNMLGLLGNVAEVKELRPYLITPVLMENFRILLKRTQQNDIEIPYNCGGVLANILSDGIQAWSIESTIPQQLVDQEMYDSVQTWDLRRQRTINYRSLAPILRLLNEEFPSGCIMWAVWAMTNLTTVSPEKYCTLVRNEHGEPLLTRILHSERLSEAIKTYAQEALNNVHRFYNTTVSVDALNDDAMEED